MGENAEITSKHYLSLFTYNKTKDIAQLAAILGHSSIETTRNYLKILTSELQKEMDKLEESIDNLSNKVRKREENKTNKTIEVVENEYNHNQVLE